ncbi:hypothetical protein ARMSODRAFT_966448 [Armillaria solidipes]|uniref:Uncharacterized protein n=1 Tax=Armillaria solidipes TaxID=1076256 RepID=A0A2H3ATK1_9AGAR|nr:hypothetical protein ARMSODRAFT_966448 [Armillaria solidipes]
MSATDLPNHRLRPHWSPPRLKIHQSSCSSPTQDGPSSCGFLGAMRQTVAYWLMGAMSNDPSKLVFFSGFYKSIQ